MISPKALRESLLKEAGEFIGTYLLPGGQTVPAISFGSGAFPPPGVKTQGLEVVVLLETESDPSALVGGATRWDTTSKILLKQWDGSGDTIAATLAIVPLLGNQVKVSPRILPTDKLGNIETRTITFTQTFIRRTHGNNNEPSTL